MTYATGTISSSTPSTEMLVAIETLLTGHPSWEFVEEHVDGSYTNRIWKNLGTLNSWGEDFYVAFMRTTSSIGTTPIQLKVAEQYSTATKKAKRGNPNPGSTFTANSDDASAYGETEYAFSSTSWWSSSYTSLSVSTSAFQYFIVATADAIILANAVNTHPLYAGLFKPYLADMHVGFEFPLCLVPLGYGDADGSGSFTRLPGYQGFSTTDAFSAYWVNSSSCWAQTPLGTVGGTSDKLYGTTAFGAELLAMSGNSGVGARGVFRDLLVFNGAGAKGDTLTIGGETWVNIYSGVWANTEK